MPYGTPRQVEAEVIRLIELLGAEGGYVVAASNAVQPDVPIENILALYCTARDYRYSREPVRSCRRASLNRSE